MLLLLFTWCKDTTNTLKNNKTNNFYYFLVRDDEMELSREEEPKSIASSPVNSRGDVCSIKPTESSLNIISSVRY